MSLPYTQQGPFTTGGTCTAAQLTAIDQGVKDLDNATPKLGAHNGVTGWTISAGNGAPATLAANEIYIQLS